MKLSGKDVMTCCFVLVGIYAATTALKWPFRSAFFPVTMGVCFTLLMLTELYLSLFSRKVRKKQTTYDFKLADGIDPAVAKQRTIRIFLWIVAYYLLIQLVGFSYAIPLFFCLFFRFQGKEGWKMSVGLALLAWLSFYGLFIWLLDTQYPESWLQRGLNVFGISI